MYAHVYVVDVPIHSISGTHAITEEDLGLEPGTLPPEELATLGHLIVVDKRLLAPLERIRARTKRLLSSTGVKVGLGTVVTAEDLPDLVDKLEELQAEFYAEKAQLVAEFDNGLQKRVAEHPKYAHLIRRYAPDVRRIERRLSYDIDSYKFDVPANDPNQGMLKKTLSRSGNDISRRLMQEVAVFADGVYAASIGKSGRLVKQNMGPLRDTLLPKVRSFQLLDSSLCAISSELTDLVRGVCDAIDAQPTGHAFLEGTELAPFEQRINQLRSVSGLEALIRSKPVRSSLPEQSRLPMEDRPTASPDDPAPTQPPQRPAMARRPDGVPARRPVSF